MIGWAAVTGDVGWGALALFAIIFFWTPPHFWALSLYRAGDYAAAGVPMLPVVAGARETKRQMLLYTLVLWPVTLTPWLLGIAGAFYAVGAGALSLRCSPQRDPGLARRRRRRGGAQRTADVCVFAALSVPDLPLLLVDQSPAEWVTAHGAGSRSRDRASARSGAQPGAADRAGGAGGAVLRARPCVRA